MTNQRICQLSSLIYNLFLDIYIYIYIGLCIIALLDIFSEHIDYNDDERRKHTPPSQLTTYNGNQIRSKSHDTHSSMTEMMNEENTKHLLNSLHVMAINLEAKAMTLILV